MRLAVLGLLSAAGYAAATFALPASNRTADVAAFIGLFWLLFALLALAPAAARGDGCGRSRVGVILLFAALFRLLLLPAGASSGGGPWSPDPGPPAPAGVARAVADDLAGRRVAFEEHLLYDDDLWRYLWDGHVGAAGLDPYRRSPREIEAAADAGDPGAEALLQEERWWDVLERVNFPGYRTVYPPAAQLLFRLSHAVAPGSVVVWKLLVVLLDLGTCLLLVRLLDRVGRPREEVLFYAWNPLAVGELAGSGHVDALMIFLTVLAVERLVAADRPLHQAAGLAAWAAATAAKLGAAVLAPLVALRTLLRRGGRGAARWWWVAPAVLTLLCLPYLSGLPALAGALAAFGRHWEFNSGPWGLVAWLAGLAGATRPELWARALCGAALLPLVLLPAWNAARAGGREGERLTVHAAFLALGAAVLLSPTVMPWYLLWALPFAVAAGYRSWVLLTALSLLSYLIYATHAELAWWRWLEHGGFALALGWELRARPRLAAELASLVMRVPGRRGRGRDRSGTPLDT